MNEYKQLQEQAKTVRHWMAQIPLSQIPLLVKSTLFLLKKVEELEKKVKKLSKEKS